MFAVFEAAVSIIFVSAICQGPSFRLFFINREYMSIISLYKINLSSVLSIEFLLFLLEFGLSCCILIAGNYHYWGVLEVR